MIKRINDSNIYEIDLSEFLTKQKDIMEKYKGKLAKNTRMEIIDKYFLQTMEEVWEVKNESNPISKLYEEIDVLMYLASLYAVILDCEDSIVHPDKYFTIVDASKENPFNFDNITDDLISLRRLMPERKWHKAHNGSLSYINFIASDVVMDLMKKVINSIIYDEYKINSSKSVKIPIVEKYMGLKEESLLK